MNREKFLGILPLVSKPSRYIGAEVNSCIKDPAGIDLRVALCFPDTYEVGISHLGLKVLYGALNRRPEFYAERAYCPWPDMEEKMREQGVLLTTLETGTPLSEMDIVGFTLQYELSYTNILTMLDLAGIPLESSLRDEGHPLVIAGGPCAFNPEPLSRFIDAFVIGDSEEAVLEIAETVVRCKKTGAKKVERLKALSEIEGVYIPAHFEVVRGGDGSITAIKNVAGGSDTVLRRVVADLEHADYPEHPILPYVAAVHNRVTLEVARGCLRGCRFCQAGYVYRPFRERSPERIMELAQSSVSSTGYEELSLSSLSTGDYSALLPLMTALMDRYEGERVSISLPSLRVGTLTPEMCTQIKRVRKTGFTIAPEAGTQRLRDVINKNVTEGALIETAGTVFSEGWDLIKLYFMVGLPTETDDDVLGIADLSRKVLDAGRKAGGRKKKVNVGVSAFVPKPHTPFQWMGQIPMSEIRRRKDLLSKTLGRGQFAIKSGLAETSVLEAAFSRGGRELGAALLIAWQKGARFDGWTERFEYRLWDEAFADAGLDLNKAAERSFALDEVLPWEHIDTGVKKKFLIKEYDRALKGEATPDCRTKCAGCGLKCLEEDFSPAYPAPIPRQMPTRTGKNLPPARVRLTYTKLMPLALLSHNEMMTLFFRAISRAGLPILFSEGFNPHPKVSFGPALAVGIESEAEILDMELSYALDLNALVQGLNRTMPAAVRIKEARVLRPGEPAAGVGLSSFEYEAAAPDAFKDSTSEAIQAFLGSNSIVVRRISDKGTKEIDIRPMVKRLEPLEAGRVIFTLTEADGRSARPYEVVQALFGLTPLDARAVRVKRTGMK